MRIEQLSDGTLVRVLDPVDIDLYARLLQLQTDLKTVNERLVTVEKVTRLEHIERILSPSSPLTSPDIIQQIITSTPLGRFYSYEDMLHDVGGEITDAVTGRKVWYSNRPGLLARIPSTGLPPGTWTVTAFVRGPVTIYIDSPSGIIKTHRDLQVEWRTVELFFKTLTDFQIRVETPGDTAIDYLAVRLGVYGIGASGGLLTPVGNSLISRLIINFTETTTSYDLPFSIDQTASIVAHNGIIYRPGSTNDYLMYGNKLTFAIPMEPGDVVTILYADKGPLPLTRMTIQAAAGQTLIPLPNTYVQHTELVFVNGVYALPGSDKDYIVKDNIITFTYPLSASDIVDVFYTEDASINFNRIVYVSDGQLTTYRVSDSPLAPDSELVFAGGVLQTPGIENDYVVSGGTIIFNNVPEAGMPITIITLTGGQ